MRQIPTTHRRIGRHQRDMLAYLLGHPGATVKQIARDLPFPNGCSSRFTNSVLYRLLDRDFISRKWFGRKYHYYAKD